MVWNEAPAHRESGRSTATPRNLLLPRQSSTPPMHRPLPSMLILMAQAFSTPVKSVLVNWLPWARASARTGGALSLAVEDLRLTEPPQRLFQGIDTEVGVPRVRNPPGQHRPRVPVHDRHQVDEALGQRDIDTVWVVKPNSLPDDSRRRSSGRQSRCARACAWRHRVQTFSTSRARAAADVGPGHPG